jgi:hypothetical protein
MEKALRDSLPAVRAGGRPAMSRGKGKDLYPGLPLKMFNFSSQNSIAFSLRSSRPAFRYGKKIRS